MSEHARDYPFCSLAHLGDCCLFLCHVGYPFDRACAHFDLHLVSVSRNLVVAVAEEAIAVAAVVEFAVVVALEEPSVVAVQLLVVAVEAAELELWECLGELEKQKFVAVLAVQVVTAFQAATAEESAGQGWPVSAVD